MKPFLEVRLQIGGSHVNPDICTQLLGVPPDKQWKRGECFTPVENGTEIVRKTGLWIYCIEKHVHHDDPYDPLPLVNHFIRTFAEKKAAFDQIHKSMSDGERPSFPLEYPDNLKYATISLDISWGVVHGFYALDKRTLETILEIGIDEVRCGFVSIENEEEEGNH